MRLLKTSEFCFLRFSRELQRVRASNFAYKLVVFIVKSAREDIMG